MDKVQKIREEVEKLKSNLMYGACSSQIAMETMCKEEAYNEVLAILDTMQEEPVSKDLGEYINELSKQFPEVSFAKLSRIAVRVVKWQKEQFEKERLKHCDGLTDEQAQIESDFVAQHLKDNNRTPTFIDAIEYGMKMQKEQMMAKATDGIVRPDDDEVWCYLKSFNFKDGDKVKVIVIKED